MSPGAFAKHHASLANNGGTRCRTKRPPATPQGSTLSFQEELQLLKLRHGLQGQAPAEATGTLQGTTAPKPVLPWLWQPSTAEQGQSSNSSTGNALPLPPANPPPEATTSVVAAPTETTAKEEAAQQDTILKLSLHVIKTYVIGTGSAASHPARTARHCRTSSNRTSRSWWRRPRPKRSRAKRARSR